MNTEGAGTLEIAEPSSRMGRAHPGDESLGRNAETVPDSTPDRGGGPRALIVNAYAMGNRGDAAIVEGIVDSVRRAGFATVTVAPVDWRDPTPWISLGIDEVVPPLISLLDAPSWARRMKPAMLGYAVAVMLRSRLSSGGSAIRAYRRADLVVSAGGAYLGGSKPGINLVKLGNVRAGVDAGRPTVMAPITVNPSSRIVRSLIRWGCGAVRLFVRDEPSRQELAAIGLSSEIVPDMALRAPSLVRRAGRTSTPRAPTGIIGWAPRGYRADHRRWGQPSAAEETVVAAMERLLSETTLRLRFIAHVRAGSDDDDRQTVDRLASRLVTRFGTRIDVADEVSSLDEALDRYADLDLLVTSRMHAGIFAMSTGTPALAIGYEPKVHGVMDGLGLADRVVAASDRVTVDEVVDQVKRLLDPGERERTAEAFRLAQSRFALFDACLEAAAARARAVATTAH
jgi:polysaccharide pyruvyl transferase WcaK-like protein